MARRLDRMLAGTTAVELLIAAYLGACGLAWLAAGNGMDGISSYRIMLQVMSDDGWGASWLAIGLIWILASHRHWRRIRRVAAILAAGTLIWCGITFVLSNPATALGWGMLVLGLGAGAAALQIR